MRIVCISDTHNRHRAVIVPPGDVLIHAGDLTGMGSIEEVYDALCWFGAQKHRHKIVIAGNHDWLFERAPVIAAKQIPPGVHYLQDSGCVIEGLNFWGSPVQPAFLGWAFNRTRGADIDRHWAKIPVDIHVLVTHGPPHGKLDRVGYGEHVGCEMLRRRLAIIRPNLHVFGHVHSAYGTDVLGPTRLVNAAICTEQYLPTNAPIVVDL